MKKLVLILLIFPLFIACGDDENSPDSLVGTVWKTELKGDYYSYLHFKLNTECEDYDTSETGKILFKETVKYKYNHPNIVFEPTIFGDKACKIDGDQIIVYKGDDISNIFYKQK